MKRPFQPSNIKRKRTHGFRSRMPPLLVLAKPNALPCPRLGLAVAKKYMKLAVQRNWVKCLACESFRQNINSLQ